MNVFLGGVDFLTSWQAVWGPAQTAIGSFATFLGAIGVLMVVLGIFAYIWERRRSGSGGNHQKLIWTIAIGAILSTPGVIIPVILFLTDYVVNGFISVLPHASTGGK